MVLDYFDSPVAYNPDSDELVTGATFQVFAVDDSSYATPLAVTDPASGANIPVLSSSNIGVLPAFRVAGDVPQVVLKSGAFTTLLSSRFGALVEAGFDADEIAAAIAAAPAAEAARDAALAAEEAAAAVPAQIAVRANAVGIAGAQPPGDYLKVVTYDEAADFLIPIGALSVPAGTELTLRSIGAGAARIVAEEENLFPFPDAVAGYSGGIWQVRGAATISVASGVGPGGSDAIRVTSTASGSSGAFGHNGHAGGQWLLADLGLKAGDVVSARAWLAPPAGQNGRIQLRFYNGATVLSEAATTGTTGTGVRYVTNAVIPAGTTHIAVVSYSTATGVGVTSDIAQVRIRRGAAQVDTYVDGASTDGYWWGTAHQSPSSVGIVRGDSLIPARGGRAILRHEGDRAWRVSIVGPSADTLRRGNTLAIDKDNGQQGIFAPLYPFSTSDTALASGRPYYTRFDPPSRDMLIQAVGFRLTTPSVTDDPLTIQVHSAAGALLATSGSLTGYLNGSAGMRFVPIPPTLLVAGAPGYIVLDAQSTAAVRRGTVLADAFGTAIPALASGYGPSVYPPASTVPALTASDAAILFVLREFM
jgi:hypothetical protein